MREAVGQGCGKARKGVGGRACVACVGARVGCAG